MAAKSTEPTTSDPVWHRVDAELTRRKQRHETPGTWLALRNVLGVSAQTLGNWKARGVPRAMREDIADALGWSVDKLLGRDEPYGSDEPDADDDRNSVSSDVWLMMAKIGGPLDRAMIDHMRVFGAKHRHKLGTEQFERLMARLDDAERQLPS